ncbi:MAG: hypothetical protein N2746_10095 [Deltaproteobacteria bacterium]|nr:hypothetical protein [Deltaproteobacteria bacterium]
MRTIAILIIVSFIGCGTYEGKEINATSNQSMHYSGKFDLFKRLSAPFIPNFIMKVEVSITDDPSTLFSEAVKSEFSINTVIDLYIASRFSFYSGIHTIEIKVYLPDGNLYINSRVDVDFDVQASYSLDSVIIENDNSILIAKYIMPVAGTELAILMITGIYKTEIYLDGVKVAEREFLLK